MTSHTIAPISPHSSTPNCHFTSMSLMLMRSPPMVLATRVPNSANATKLKNAAQTTATPGESTRVDTTVAIELAASCHPLTKSNIRATTIISKTNADSVVIQGDLRKRDDERSTRCEECVGHLIHRSPFSVHHLFLTIM